jgi:hypothetical protein
MAKAWNSISHCIAGILGGLIAVGILHWFSLPDHNTIDMLSFTESAFGIGMTVIALVFSLVLVKQVKEIDSRFDEKSKEFDERFKRMEDQFKSAMEIIARTKNTELFHAASSMTTVGLSNITAPGVRVTDIIIPDGRINKNA